MRENFSDRATLEQAEARTLVHGFTYNNQSKEWLTNALKVSKRIYGNGSEIRIRAFMREIWRTETCLGLS